MTTTVSFSPSPAAAAAGDLCDLPARTMLELLKSRQISACELLDAHLARIATINPRVNALVTVVDPDALRACARELDTRWARGEWQGPLHGLPVSQKDLTATRGVRTTFGSPLFS